MPRPNLLFIFTDEQRADTMAAYGNSIIQTPTLNRLTAQSTVFDQAYVTQPVCTPSRSTILTGQWPHTNGLRHNNIPLSPETRCLPEFLESGDYYCGYHGKWHLGDELYLQHGFDEWVSIEDGYNSHFTKGRDKSKKSDYHHWLIENGHTPQNGDRFGRGEATSLPEQWGKPKFLGDNAGRFIRENKERPWCLYVNFLEPHMPFYGPRDDQHDLDEITLPANLDHPPTEDQPLKARYYARAYRENGFGDRFQLKTDRDWRRLICNYWGLCSLVDHHVGRILDTLTECGLDDNTIIVYTSDHGDMMGSHRLLAKTVMFEEAVRVPLIVKLPGQTKPRRIMGPVSQIDLVPTLLDLMGEPVPEGDELQGKSLGDVLRADGPARLEEPVFIEWNGRDSGQPGKVMNEDTRPDWAKEMCTQDELAAAIADPVRTVITPDEWKYNHSPLGEHELYDLNNDPFELRNMVKKPEHASRIAEMKALIDAWKERTGDR